MNKTQNRKLLQIFFISLFILFSVVFGQAQTEIKDLPSTTTWHNFQLGISTPDEILKNLGKPKKDKTEVSEQTLAIGWTRLDAGKQVRKIAYKKLGKFDSVEFTFVENKLAEINLLFKQNKIQGIAKSESNLFPAAKIPELFQIDFLLFQGMPKNSKIADYENQKETTVPKVYSQYYSMLGINKDSVVLVSVENSSLKSSLKGIFNKPTVELFPGFAQRIQIFSRP
jgi:hypothetical protein